MSLSLDLAHEGHLFDMVEGNMLDVILSLSTFGGYNPFVDLFHVYPMDLTRKIMCTTFFYHSFDSSKAYDKFMRSLNIVNVVSLVFFYIYSSKMHALFYDQL